MSQKQTTDTIERIDVSENGSPSRLAELARQAYQQRRTKDCLDLTRALLLIDPDNNEAQQMRTAIRTEIQQDLDNARTFLRQAQSRQGAEEIPQATTNVLKAELSSLPGSDQSSPESPVGVVPLRKFRWLATAAVIAAAIILVAVVMKFSSSSNAIEASIPAPIVPELPRPIVNESAIPPAPPAAINPVPVQTASVSVPLISSHPITATAIPGPRASLTDSRPDSRPESRSDSRSDVAVPVQQAAAVPGFLAVSSATSVDIYENGAYLGSAPVSLQLLSGLHTLEYRHGNLRKSVTHTINGNETTKAPITFEVSVQVNSKPWARVFLEGAERKELGQTPLGSISVPIGSVLTFENPQFQSKKYRVTGNETGIQIVFP